MTDSSEPDFEKMASNISTTIKDLADYEDYGKEIFPMILDALHEAYSAGYLAGRKDVLNKWPSYTKTSTDLGINNVDSPRNILTMQVYLYLSQQLGIKDQTGSE